MKILISGGSGLVGRGVVPDLSRDHRVDVLDLKNPAGEHSSFLRADILSLSSLTRVIHDYDAVVHLAGIPHPLNDPPEKVFQVNTVGTFNMLEACALTSIPKFIFMSSESTLGFAFSKTRMWPEYLPIDEEHPLRPQDPYGLSKVSGEMLCAAYQRTYGMETISLRAPWIWVNEPAEMENYRRLVREPERWAKNLWAYIHVRDVSQAIRRALAADPFGRHEAFFICADDQWTDLPTRALVKEFYPEVRLAADALPGRSALISTEKAASLLRFRPECSRDDLLRP
ncbi:MAG: NAD(P)-dependent oxidoreductase [Bacteroidetes bacterium]|jgi:nucleoside-diphosphate-sugar epimerase|nr:NAD(P)-dependent oxidoreductase [Bacteroidota bacterium]